MAHCRNCGAALAENAAFCGGCGATQSGGATASTVPSQSETVETGMAENVAGLLCYLIFWITGVIMLVTDKRPFVRFHATQSIVVFGALSVLWYVMRLVFGVAVFTGGGLGITLGLLVFRILQLVWLVLWIVLMLKAYQGERFRVPYAANLAEQIFGKS